MIYSEFATFYDQLFDNDLYKKWFNFVVNNINKNGLILDLACGTGRLLVLLKQHGYNAVGADLSEDMLTIAQKHLSDSGFPDTELIQANMLNLKEFYNFDSILCFDDSLCYLTDLAEIKKAFMEVYKHLNSGGKYLFDVITPYQTDVKYPGFMYNFHDEEHAFMWTTYVGEYNHSVEHDLSFFIYNKNKDAYDEFSETHFERTYSLKDYKSTLQSVGFKKITVSSDFGNKKVADDTTRWFFVCEK